MTISPLRLALSAACATAALGSAPAWAGTALPAPYLSRALDAVLLPVDAAVRDAFGLADDDSGLLVLATEPGGAADLGGLVPGDVLHMIAGHRLADPIEVDEVVYVWLLEGVVDFDFGVYRDGGWVEVVSTVTEESYWEEVELASVETWSSWEVETAFSYEEYYAEYSEEIVESYETSETLIEEVAASEAFVEETEEEVSEEAFEDGFEEVFEEGFEDEADSEAMAEEESFDEAAEEEALDEEVAEDEGFEEEGFEDEGFEEEGEEFSEDGGAAADEGFEDGGEEG